MADNMEKSQLFKKRLEDEKTRLEAELLTVGRKNPDRQGDWEPTEPADLDVDTADEEEVAESIGAFEDNAAILTQLERQLLDVNNALKNIENNTYGLCEVCQKEIEMDRLEANPAARTCKTHIK